MINFIDHKFYRRLILSMINLFLIYTFIDRTGPCSMNPCRNNGICVNLDERTYDCRCSAKYTGPNCESNCSKIALIQICIFMWKYTWFHVCPNKQVSHIRADWYCHRTPHTKYAAAYKARIFHLQPKRKFINSCFVSYEL